MASDVFVMIYDNGESYEDYREHPVLVVENEQYAKQLVEEFQAWARRYAEAQRRASELEDKRNRDPETGAVSRFIDDAGYFDRDKYLRRWMQRNRSPHGVRPGSYESPRLRAVRVPFTPA